MRKFSKQVQEDPPQREQIILPKTHVECIYPPVRKNSGSFIPTTGPWGFYP